MDQLVPLAGQHAPTLNRTPKALHAALRESVAMVNALEKVAQSALDEGEFPPEDLDNLCALITRLRRDLDAIKAALADLATGGHGE